MPTSWEELGSGGPVIAILAVLSLVSWALIIAKTLQLWNCRAGGEARSAGFAAWKSGDKHSALKSVEAGKSPADRITAYAMNALSKGFKGERLEAELARRGNEELARMNNLIRVLELIAMIAPLLGLLGTVLGMIQSFQSLEAAEGAANASVLAGGIWQALLTTAVGLVVAIPAAVGASLLAGRIESSAQMMESAVGELLLVNENPPI